MATVFGRLNYNFDATKFGDAIVIGETALQTLNSTPVHITQWQEDDMANDVVSRSRYFKNPTANVYTSLYANASILITSANTMNLFNIESAAISFRAELVRFKSHTDNVSGISSVSTSSPGVPMYDTIMSVGEQTLRLTNKTDDISNTSPILGCMTSLFIQTDLDANNNIIYVDRLALEASQTNVMFGLGNYGIRSSLSSAALTQIVTDITTANNLISVSRKHDWYFFQNERKILADFGFLSQFNQMGNTKTYLMNNYIGTSYLTQQLANT